MMFFCAKSQLYLHAIVSAVQWLFSWKLKIIERKINPLRVYCVMSTETFEVCVDKMIIKFDLLVRIAKKVISHKPISNLYTAITNF